MDKNRIASWLRGQFSLDPQPDQDLLSAETGADMVLGSVPLVSQAMALRDMERARRANDPTAGALAATGLLPFGRLGQAAKKLEMLGGRNAANAPHQALDDAVDLASKGKNLNQQWMFVDPVDKEPKFVIPFNKSTFHKDLEQGKKGDVRDLSGMTMRDLSPNSPVLDAYPFMENYKFRGGLGPNASGGYGGHYSKHNKEIVLNEKDPVGLKSSLAHEFGHGIQNFEGWAGQGANLAHIKKLLGVTDASEYADKIKAFETYLRNQGEVGSRANEHQFLQSLRPGGEHAYQNPTTWFNDRKRAETWVDSVPGSISPTLKDLKTPTKSELNSLVSRLRAPTQDYDALFAEVLGMPQP